MSTQNAKPTLALNRKFSPFRGDRALWVIIWALIAISFLIIYSSTATLKSSSLTYHLSRQSMFILFGVLAMFVVHFVDFKYFVRHTRTILYVSIILVVVAYFSDRTLNGASRWLYLTDSFGFQPSEILKVALMAYLAVQLGWRSSIISQVRLLPSLTPRGWRERPQQNRDIFNNTTMPIVFPILLSCAVIFPSDLSTALMVFMVSMLLLIVAKVRFWEVLKLTLLVTLLASAVLTTMIYFDTGRSSTWKARVESYLAPLSGEEDDITSADQDNQALIAIASGGVLGKGPGNSTQRSLANSQSDYAYAFALEEYGIMGGVVVGFLFLLGFYRAGLIARRCRSSINALLVIALSTSITVQAFINMFVSVGIVPVTGQPLPLISLGGSSVFCTCVAFGMILSVSRQNYQEDEIEARLAESGEIADADFGQDSTDGSLAHSHFDDYIDVQSLSERGFIARRDFDMSAQSHDGIKREYNRDSDDSRKAETRHDSNDGQKAKTRHDSNDRREAETRHDSNDRRRAEISKKQQPEFSDDHDDQPDESPFEVVDRSQPSAHDHDSNERDVVDLY